MPAKLSAEPRKYTNPSPLPIKKTGKTPDTPCRCCSVAPCQLPEHAVHRQKRGAASAADTPCAGRPPAPQKRWRPSRTKTDSRTGACRPARGIAGQKFTALRDIFDEPEVHRHIAIAVWPVWYAPSTRCRTWVCSRYSVMSTTCSRQAHRAPLSGSFAMPRSRAAVQNAAPDARRDHCRQRDGGQCKAQYHRKQCRQHGQQRHAEPAAQRHDHRSRPVAPPAGPTADRRRETGKDRKRKIT